MKLTVAFTCTSLPLNLYTSVSDAVVVSDGRSTDLAKKRHGSADLHPPIHPPLVNFPTKFGVKFTTSFPSSQFD